MADANCSIGERPAVSMLDDLGECLFRIRLASDLALEIGQPLHDKPETHYIIDRLSFLTSIIGESVKRAEALSHLLLQSPEVSP